MVTLRFLNKNKNTVVVDVDRVKKIPKRIANTKLRQKTRRANLVRKKRGIKSKSKSSTLSLPSSEKNVDDLLKDLKL
jgi:thermostable 8-oxoguanine DNA glycosylase